MTTNHIVSSTIVVTSVLTLLLLQIIPSYAVQKTSSVVYSKDEKGWEMQRNSLYASVPVNFQPDTLLDYMDFFLVGDLDGDGFGDIAGRLGETGTMAVESCKGNAIYNRTADWSEYGDSAPVFPFDLGDGDSDGKNEIIAFSSSPEHSYSEVQVWEASEPAGIPDLMVWSKAIDPFTTVISKYGNLDGDDKMEIIILEKKEEDPFFTIEVFENTGDDLYTAWVGNPFVFYIGEGSPQDFTMIPSNTGSCGGCQEIFLLWNCYSSGATVEIYCSGNDTLNPDFLFTDFGYMVFGSGRVNSIAEESGLSEVIFGIFNNENTFVHSVVPSSGVASNWLVPENSLWKSCDTVLLKNGRFSRGFLCNASRGLYFCTQRSLTTGPELKWSVSRSKPVIVFPGSIGAFDMDADGKTELLVSEWNETGGRLIVFREDHIH